MNEQQHEKVRQYANRCAFWLMMFTAALWIAALLLYAGIALGWW